MKFSHKSQRQGLLRIPVAFGSIRLRRRSAHVSEFALNSKTNTLQWNFLFFKHTVKRSNTRPQENHLPLRKPDQNIRCQVLVAAKTVVLTVFVLFTV